jgi:hypothetical protein
LGNFSSSQNPVILAVLTGCPKTIQEHIMPCDAIRNALFYKGLFCIAIHKLRDKWDFSEFLGSLLNDCGQPLSESTTSRNTSRAKNSGQREN